MASIAHLDRPPSFAVGEGLPPQGPTPRLLNGVGVSPPAGPEPGACWPSPRPVAWGGSMYNRLPLGPRGVLEANLSPWPGSGPAVPAALSLPE